MRRLLYPLFLVFLLLGLVSSMSAYAWKTVLRPSVVKGSQEEPTEKEGASEELFALFRTEPKLPKQTLLPQERNTGPRQPPSRQPVQSRPPEQAVAPRVVVIWRPLCLGLDDEPAIS